MSELFGNHIVGFPIEMLKNIKCQIHRHNSAFNHYCNRFGSKVISLNETETLLTSKCITVMLIKALNDFLQDI